MLPMLIHIALAILNLVDALMLDSALREFGRIPSHGHILHHCAQWLNPILAGRLGISVLILWYVITWKKVHWVNTVLAIVAVVLLEEMIWDNYWYLVLE